MFNVATLVDRIHDLATERGIDVSVVDVGYLVAETVKALAKGVAEEAAKVRDE